MSDLVSQRTHEIGIRAALGASAPKVMGMVIGQGLKLALIGIVVGVVRHLSSRPVVRCIRKSYCLTFTGEQYTFDR